MAPSPSDVDRILSLLNTRDVEVLKKEEYDMFQYVGFDPYRLLQTLVDCKNSGGISDSAFSDDVMKMVAVGLIKGSVNDHNIHKMSEAGQKDLNTLMKKYKIGKGGGKGKAADVVTFPRVMATFPNLAVRMTKVLGGRKYTGPLLSADLPDVMCIQVFPSVIPQKLDEKIRNFLLTAALAYSVDQTIKLTQNDKPNVTEIAKTQSAYIQMSFNSPMPKESVRISTFNVLGLPGAYTQIARVVNQYKKMVDSAITIPSEIDFKKELAVV